MLDRNIEYVDEFFTAKLNEYTRRLNMLVDKYNPGDIKTQELDPEELEDLINMVLELRSQFRKLQWYSEVNKRGFVKILKKLDKKVQLNTQKRYLNSKVLVLPFANASTVEAKLLLTNKYIEELSPYVSDLANIGGLDADVKLSSDLAQLSTRNTSTTSLETDTSLQIRKLIAENNTTALENFIAEQKPSKKILMSALYKAISQKAYECILILLGHVDLLQDSFELNGRTIFHKLIINNARARQSEKRELFLSPAFSPAAAVNRSAVYGSDGVNSNDDVEVLEFLLNNLKPEQRNALIAVDEFQRTPLHYAAQHGLKALTKVVISHMQTWGLLDRGNGFDGPEWCDSDGSTPIQLAVLGNHPLTTKVILDSVEREVAQLHDSSNLLSISTRLGSPELLNILLEQKLDVNYVDDTKTNETCLYIAAKLNYIKIVHALLAAGANTEIKERTYGWTPLFIASVQGYEDVVKALLAAGADTSIVDGSGWTAMEHACLRGHLNIMEITKPVVIPGVPLFFSGANSPLPAITESESESNRSTSPLDKIDPLDKSQSTSATASSSSVAVEDPVADGAETAVKTFGHRYLRESSMILLNLGSMDMRETNLPVELNRVPYSKASSTQMDTALSLVISTSNSPDEPYVVDLPITEDAYMEQIAFYVNDTENISIYFDIVPTYFGNRNKVIGRGVGLVSDMVASSGSDRMRSLYRTVTVPILELSSLEVLGKLRFQFLVVNPFKHPRIGVAKSATYWKQLITTRVVGHRGLGKNSNSLKSLQLGENTLESFIQAANLGASYVEFDVQLTKDYVPVVYHDFLVSETGIDIPTQSITLEQFLSISDNHHGSTSPKHRRAASPPVRKGKDLVDADDDNGLHRGSKGRSLSMYTDSNGYESSRIDQRLKNTRDFKLKGFKGNMRGHSIQSPVTTLEHVFKSLPKNVGFNIECKYPMLDESQLEDMDTFALELNFWVDTVLKCVYDNADGRDIIFSSFHPEVCIMLSLKQPSIPVLFLTEGGTAPMQDIRASSLQEAIRLAKRWDLLGIVSESTPLVKCPRLINVVKENGLVCVTYGTLNNDPIIAKEQIQNGVDAVIVDSVLAVRQGLTEGHN